MSTRVRRAHAQYCESAGTIAAIDLSAVLKAVERRGIDTGAILASVRIEPATLSDPFGRVPAQLEHRLWEAVELATNDPSIGLRLGVEHARNGPASLLEYIALNSPTLGQALQGAQHVVPLFDDRGYLDVIEAGDQVRVGIRRDGIGRALGYVDFVSALAYTLYSLHVENFRLTAVHLKRAAPPALTPYTDTFGVRPRFGAEKNELIFPRHYLEQPLLGADPNVRTYLQDHADNLLETLSPADPFVDRVQRALARAIQARTASPEAVAKSTGTSVRTLRRRLALAGTSYRALLDELRHSFASHSLEQTDDSMDAIADALGFSSRTAFQRAFKRYAAQSPSEYRAARRSGRP